MRTKHCLWGLCVVLCFGGSVVANLLFNVLPIVCSFFLVCLLFCPILFCNHLDEEERAGCFAVNVLLLCLTAPLVGLQFVIVVFPDHTHFLTPTTALSGSLSSLIKVWPLGQKDSLLRIT